MKKNEIRAGGRYTARVSGNLTTVRVDAIRECTGWDRDKTVYDVTNLTTGRKTTFRSAAKFRAAVPLKLVAIPNAPDCDPAREAERDARDVEETECQDDAEEGEQRLPFASVQAAEPTSNNPKTTPEAATTQPAVSTLLTTAPLVSTIPSLAAKIIAARNGRAVGSPVAGMTPNDEQEGILAAAVESGLKCFVVAAGAGTGKTATLKMLEEVLPGRGQYTAFNKSLVTEAKTKFKKASCRTTHGLAFGAVGKHYEHRLDGDRMKSYQIARILGIEPLNVVLKGMGAPDEDGKGTDKTKVLQADFLAGQVLTAIERFCQSADRSIGREHLRYIDGIDPTTDDGKRGYDNNNLIRDYLLPFLAKAWDDLANVNGTLPFKHDHYVKIWQLGTGNDRPIIAADYILLDEAQDTAPVFLDIIQQQLHALVVLVGDSNQAIYEWRGAVDAMKAYPGAPRRLLSQSYRFGQAIADVANAVLATLDEPTDLVMRGLPTIPSRVDVVPAPRCYLYRTNAGAVSQVMRAIEEGKRPHLIGGGAEVVSWCQAAMDLQSKRGTRHPELCCFESWEEVETYSKTDEGGDLRLMVKLVNDFGAEAIRDALKDMPKEEKADLVVSTAHKSKGREWDTVKLGADFPTANKMGDADRRLLYVAATRAKMTLDISVCPPFCGGPDKGDNGDGAGARDTWIPGLAIAYTAAMPTAEAQSAFLAAKDSPETPIAAPTAKDSRNDNRPANGNLGINDSGRMQTEPKDDFTWAKWGEKWGIRGKGGVALGTRVTVTRRNGTTSVEKVKSVLKVFADATIYEV